MEEVLFIDEFCSQCSRNPNINIAGLSGHDLHPCGPSDAKPLSCSATTTFASIASKTVLLKFTDIETSRHICFELKLSQLDLV